METPSIEQLKYPIGKFQKPEIYTPQLIDQWIKDIEVLPSLLRKAVEGLSNEQLDTPYRPEGWTVRQVVHHLPDSHTNSYIRFKLALTEDNPRIKPYEEADWAQLPDGKSAPIELSLNLLDALHVRWVFALKSMSPDQLDKTFYHPGNKLTYQVKENIGIYSWHGRHHLAHITSLKSRMGW
jgi:hypothetical protein